VHSKGALADVMVRDVLEAIERVPEAAVERPAY
jgi:hypothetical protein